MSGRFTKRLRWVAISPLALAWASSSHAEAVMADQAASSAAPAAAAATAADKGEETIVVTGTSAGRTEFRTPAAVTTMDSNRLQLLSTNSQADVLAVIPALKAEGGGGEVAANIYIAGLPSSGQFSFTPIEFNGSPTLGLMGVNSSAPDIYKRPDLGVERLEFVRGGISNLFGGGGIGGIINYIDKKGGDEHHGQLAVEVANHSRLKTNFALNGPITQELHYALSGWYRYDEGPLYSGFKAKGYQLRGNISRMTDRSQITLYAQAINDRTPFYGDIPQDGKTLRRARGNDGKEVLNTQTSALSNISFQTPSGLYTTDVADGAYVSGYSFGGDFKTEFDDGWGLNGRFNIGSYDHSFVLFGGGDNVTTLPLSQTGFLQGYAAQFGSTPATFNPANYTGAFTFADSGATVPGAALLWADRVIDRSRHLSTATGEINLTKELKTGDISHHLTLGAFFGQTDAKDFNVTYSYVGEFTNAPRLVNVAVTNNATGATTILSKNGLVGSGIGYVNKTGDGKRYAVYLADQTEFGNWTIDIGGRWEKLVGSVSQETSQSYPGGASAAGLPANTSLSRLLSNVTWGSGRFLTGKVDPSAWALAGNVLYKISPDVSLFASASRGFFMPELRGVVISSNGDVQSFEPQIIKQVMGGVKFRTSRFNGSLAGYYAGLSNQRNVQLLNGPTPGSPAIEVVNLVSSRTYGIEGTLTAQLFRRLSFDGNFTWQRPKYTQYTPVAACTNCDGNRVQRQPDFVATGGLYYSSDLLDITVLDTYTGRTFTSDLNNIRLRPYNIVRADVTAKLHVNNDQILRVGVSVYNLFDNQGLTQGNARAGTLQAAGQAYFVGRAVLPRRVTLRASYAF